MILQITPAHDLNDFEFKEHHNCESDIIESINIFNLNDFEFKERHNCESNIIESNIFTDDGKINSNGGSEFAGMPRFNVREAVIESLQKKVLVLHYCVYKLINLILSEAIKIIF